ncbi:DUF6443 domain-containing protein [Hufsiella ginkgonis]|uniref:RHS repeat-associated core domain-containing protein n=1 Tax=Hufsiella ginkgonis TaxID=2695274 RepID=A0A7K1XSN4_9SPHI|nr:DUF6443 domain-containing protein [Hufsiella ginkgonis]MXV13920.1 RHS repeat-associated core domain-containing protein [Hufsiella ginkgonis]
MKKTFFLTGFFSLLLAATGSFARQHVSTDTYAGQTQIRSSESIRLLPGFSTGGSEVRIKIVPTFAACTQLNATPSATQNYVVSYVVKVPGITSQSQLASLSGCELSQTIQYLDGLGRPLQTVQTKASPAGKDIIQPVAYDSYGRELAKYQPYTTSSGTAGSYRPSALSGTGGYTGSEQYTFFQQTGQEYTTTTTPFAESQPEASPLGRPMLQGAPGTDWQIGAGHLQRVEYGANNTDNSHASTGYPVRLWRADTVPTSGQLYKRRLVLETANSGYYPAGELRLVITKDENWASGDGKKGTVEEYTDKEGHIVLKRIFNYLPATSAIEVLSTYYVYDDLGNLSFVLPPKANGDGGSISQTLLDNLCYQYRYDTRARLIEKRIPGKGWDLINYNLLDEPLFSQDSVQRTTTVTGFTPGQYHTFIKYDALGRTIMTGIERERTYNRSQIQDLLNGATAFWEERVSSGGYHGYSNNTIPTLTANLDPYVINYYDDYTAPGMPYASVASRYSANTKGLLTATKTAVIGTYGTFLWTVFYYDDEGRVIKTYKQHYKGANQHVNNYDEIAVTYDFTGVILSTERKHFVNSSGSAALALATDNYTDFDHAGRKLAAFQSTGGGSDVVLSRMLYNELGQLVTKKLHSENAGSTFLQEVGYSYNERGWLRTSSAPLFAMQLKYNDGTTAQYNGNIANQLWGTPGSLGNTFTYGYDRVNRLTSGVSAGTVMSEDLSYDKNGNIASLVRYDGATKIDDLSYAYQDSGNSNRLGTLTDGSSSGTGARVGAYSYAYDVNGNATIDAHTGRTITYNFLNLVQTVNSTGGLTYTYDGSGTKLRKVSNGTATDYISGIQYTGGTLDFVQTEEGRALNSSNTYSYYYDLEDHLGNVRVSFYKNPTTGLAESTQADNYFPFGMRKVAAGGSNKYLYNGKELQEELGQYDYKRRFYDPVIGRFTSVDPIAEHFPWMTSYQYASNNPSSKIDLDGLEGLFPFMEPALMFGNSSWVPRMAPMAEASRIPGGLRNLAKAGGEVAGKAVGELIKTAERAVKTEEHHLMPKEFKGNEVIDAAREGGFKFEGAENKISLEKFSRATGEGQHGNHPSYNETIGQKLADFVKNNPEYSTTDALKFVRGLTQEMRQMIENNPAVKVNELFKVKSIAPSDNTKVIQPKILPAKKEEEEERPYNPYYN